ncbi:MAG: choice-of-anchor A family protein [Lachnospiraceae bacterium]|nr:choice-of-anchor A family protein [Lachnospiraceae bacterium]
MKKKLFTKIAALAMTAVLALGNVNITPNAADTFLTRTPNPATYEYTYNPEAGVNPLYAATKFHIFAQESASLSAHCNGNMATPLMHHNVNSGSNKVYTDVSGTEVTYIGQLAPGFNGTFAATTDTHIVFGRDTEIKLMNGVDVFATDSAGNYSKVNTNKDLIYKEGAKDYIDFDDEFSKLNKLSINLASEASTAEIKENVVKMPAGTDTYYINADSSQFMNRAFIIENCDFKKGQALVINVNVGTATTYELPFTQVLFKDTDGDDFGTGEDKGEYTGLGNILWNFYGTDANGNIVPFTGTLKTCTEFKGTVLAPSAHITTAASNQDGNFIGKIVDLGSGETHRWDFGGKLKNYAPTGTVTVVVKDDKGNPISDVIVKVEDTKNNTYDLETDDKGVTTTLDGLPLDKYTATITVPEGYELVVGETATKSETITEAKPDATIEFTVKKKVEAPKTGYFNISVIDKDTGALVPDVKVTISENGSTTTIESLTTGTNGKVDSSKMNLATDGTWDKYDIAITVPDGYIMYNGTSNKVTDELTDANPDKVEFVIVKKPIPTGAIQIEVVSKNAGSDEERAVEGAKVTVKDNASHIVKEVTVITDDDGLTPVVDKLELAKYTTTIDETTIPAGFKLEASETVVKDETLQRLVKYIRLSMFSYRRQVLL